MTTLTILITVVTTTVLTKALIAWDKYVKTLKPVRLRDFGSKERHMIAPYIGSCK